MYNLSYYVNKQKQTSENVSKKVHHSFLERWRGYERLNSLYECVTDPNLNIFEQKKEKSGKIIFYNEANIPINNLYDEISVLADVCILKESMNKTMKEYDNIKKRLQELRIEQKDIEKRLCKLARKTDRFNTLSAITIVSTDSNTQKVISDRKEQLFGKLKLLDNKLLLRK